MNEYTKVNWQDGTVLQPAKVTIDGTDYNVEPAVESGTTPVNATNLDKMDTALKQAHDGVRDMEVNKINKATIELLTVDSVAPEHCNTGDLYYNTTTNFIYTATATDTWSETGELPSSKYLYVDLLNSKLYYYDGTNFTSYGGGSSNDVVISPDQPTGNDWKLWIDSDEVGSQASEITNSYSESTGLGYSANYINNNVGVVDSESNENGRYIKFSDGTMICTKSITGTLGGIAWGNVYYSDHTIGSWAETFITIYNVVASIDANQYWCNVAGGGFNSVRVFRPNNGTTTGTIRLFAIGSWK